MITTGLRKMKRLTKDPIKLSFIVTFLIFLLITYWKMNESSSMFRYYSAQESESNYTFDLFKKSDDYKEKQVIAVKERFGGEPPNYFKTDATWIRTQMVSSGKADPLTQSMQKLVHLDLKGAAPKLDYLKALFPLLKLWGATGLLIEYEDMFPYYGNLETLKGPDAYSQKELAKILDLAAKNDLMVIPLVQTFGHMEFALKYEKFKDIRENENNPMDICPVAKGADELVEGMLQQMLSLHPNIKYLHIGCDEIYGLGKSERSKTYMQEKQIGREELYLQWIKGIAKMVQKISKGKVIPLIWDDMIRKWSTSVILKSEISKYVEPMVWKYTTSLDEVSNSSLWQKYNAVFKKVWIASSFKGATGVDQYFTNIEYHLANHESWIKLLRMLKKETNIQISGIALTGWTRYDHFATLCELFPAAVPSLVACLQTVHYGTWNDKVQQKVSSLLNCNEILNVTVPDIQGNYTRHAVCKFPGALIYDASHELLSMNSWLRKLFNTSATRGWFSQYNLKKKFVNPYRINWFIGNKNNTQNYLRIKSLYYVMPTLMKDIFYQNDIEEFVQEHIVQPSKSFIKIMDSYMQVRNVKTWTSRFHNEA